MAESTPRSTGASSAPLLEFWRCFARHAGARWWFALALFVAMSVLEAYGLLLLVPLLHTIGLGAPAAGGAGWESLGRWGVPSTAPALLGIIVVLKAAQTALRAWSGEVNLRLQSDFTLFLSTRFYRAMAEANWLFVARQRSSDLAQTLLEELPRLGVAVHHLLAILGLALLGLAQLAIAFALSPAMTLFALFAGGAVVLCLHRLRRRAQSIAELGQNRRQEMAAAVTEHLAGLKLAKSHGRESHHVEDFLRAMRASVDQVRQLHRANAFSQAWIEVGGVAALAAFTWFALEVWNVSTPRLLVLAFAFSRLLAHASRLQALWHQFSQFLPSFSATEAQRARLVAAAEPAPPLVAGRCVLTRELRLEHVLFRHDPQRTEAALRDVTLTLPARSVTAICGASGAGKSTLADVLLGLLAPTEGRVLSDGVALDGPRLHEWRRSIGYVPQETFLFHDTVAANLRWAQPDATDADMRAALQAAAADDFVARLPQGLATILGDRGVRLSGGERQRLALARALLRRPTLLVLDEATSALDPHNERLVQDAIERLRGELTIVLIAHRLSTVRFADRIVVLERGAVAEAGTWDELCGREQGLFRRLVAADAIT